MTKDWRLKWLTSRLLPCPFCGAHAEALPQKVGYLVRCTICNARMIVFSKYQRQVIVEWNNRK